VIITIDEIVVGDPPDAWRDAGFLVDDDGTCRIGGVAVRLVGTGHGRRILGWRLGGIDPAGLDEAGTVGDPAAADGPVPGTVLDGLPTATSSTGPVEPAEHPNGVLGIDHVVLLTPDTDRTRAALEAVGFEARRVRETDQYGSPMVQTFFRAGPVIVELVGPVVPLGDGEPGFFGLAYVVADLDATATLLGEHLGEPKEAVQEGRRVATLRHKDLGMSVAQAFMSI
jgi:hypothetical protein